MDHLRTLFDEYADRVTFYFVYVTEAGHEVPRESPFSRHSVKVGHEQRKEAVRKTLEEMKLPFPCLFDRADGAVEKLYDARPLRMVVVGKNGRMLFGEGGRIEDRWHLGQVKQLLVDALAAR